MSIKTLEKKTTKSILDQLEDIRKGITQEVSSMSFTDFQEYLTAKESVLESHASAHVDRSFLKEDLYALLPQKIGSYDAVGEVRKIRTQMAEEIKEQHEGKRSWSIYVNAMKTYKTLFVYFFLILSLSCQGSSSIIKDCLLYTNPNKNVNLAPNIKTIEDPKHLYTIEDILGDTSLNFKDVTHQSFISFGISRSKYWLDFSICNETDEKLIIYQSNPWIKEFNVYIIDEFGNVVVKKSGLKENIDNWDYNTSGFLFELGHQPERIIIETQTDTDLNLQLQIGTSRPIIETLHRTDLIKGILIGIFTLLIFYNFFIYINIFDRSYFWYTLYLLSNLFIYLRITSVGNTFLWRDYKMINEAPSLGVIFLAFCSGMFSLYFLEIKKYAPKAATLIKFTSFSFIVFAFAYFIGYPHIANYCVHIGTLLLSISQMSIAVYILRKGYRPAFYYLLSFGLLIITSVISSMAYAAIIPVNTLTLRASSLGMVAVGIMMSNALAYKMNEHKNQALTAAEKNKKLIEEQNVILERKVIERTQELQIANSRLDGLNKSKDQLFSIIAHDLRKPALAFKGVTNKVNFLIQKKEYKMLDKLGDSIENSAIQLNSLLDNLLKWALSQKNMFTVKKQPVIVKSITSELIKTFEIITNEKRIKIDDSGVNENIVLETDPDILSTILRNLIDNAIKYSETDSTVLLKTYSDVDQVTISIIDFGRGMSKNQVKNLFEIYKGKSSPGTYGEKGSGLGLNLVNDLVKQTAGRLECMSATSKGTVMRLIYNRI